MSQLKTIQLLRHLERDFLLQQSKSIYRRKIIEEGFLQGTMPIENLDK